MSSLFRNISSLVGGHADAAAVRHDNVPAPIAPLEPPQAARAAACELPLVAYAAAQQPAPATRPRSRSRTVGLLRSTSTSAVTTRTEPASPITATRHASHPAGPHLTESERVRLQIMQAQLQLAALRLYDGPIDGNMGPATATAVRYFQTLKGIRATGVLAAGTLSALGVPLIG